VLDINGHATMSGLYFRPLIKFLAAGGRKDSEEAVVLLGAEAEKLLFIRRSMDPILSLAEIVGDFQPELSRVYHQRVKQVRDVARDAVGHSVPHGVHTGWRHGG